MRDRSERPYLNYAWLRAHLPIRRILEELHFEPLVVRGDQWRGVCPLHTASARGSGDADHQACFSVHVTKNVYRCFRCHAAGNQLDLWAAASQTTLYLATLDLCSRLQIDLAAATLNPQLPNREN